MSLAMTVDPASSDPARDPRRAPDARPGHRKPGFFHRLRHPPPVVPVVRLYGAIGRGGPLRSGLSLAGLAPALARAFAAKRSPAVALAINSPGGSPVQSALIAARIRELADENDKRVIAFVEDVAASGGYWLAVAADEIYADAASIVGSIGVVSAGFGFHEAIGRVGVERRVHTAGERKAILDPFRPEREEDLALLREIQASIHERFKAHVRARRGDRLAGEEAELFSGAFWTGDRATELGLIDGLGHLRGVLRERFGERVRPRVVGGERRFLRRRLGLTDLGLASPSPADLRGSDAAAALVEAAATGVLGALEERALWQRVGL